MANYTYTYEDLINALLQQQNGGGYDQYGGNPYGGYFGQPGYQDEAILQQHLQQQQQDPYLQGYLASQQQQEELLLYEYLAAQQAEEANAQQIYAQYAQYEQMAHEQALQEQALQEQMAQQQGGGGEDGTWFGGHVQCDLCKGYCPSYGALQEHYNDCHSKGSPYVKCDICGASFPDYDFLQNHYNTVHADPVPTAAAAPNLNPTVQDG